MATKESQEFANWPIAGKVGLAAFLAVGLSAGYYFSVYTPLAEDIAAAEAQRAGLTQQRQQAQDRHREYLAVRSELDGRAAIDRQNKRVLPERTEMPAFLQDLNRIAELSGLRIEVVEPRPEVEEPKFVKVPVQLKLRGSYHQLVKFFYNVSRLDRAISMENIRLGTPRVTGEDVALEVSVRATTYRAVAEGQTAAAAARPAGGARR